MRFHKLEICNLNSLAGHHVVDFDTTTARAGMFLIHGPTGAGKSTILDAICLALFGRTPRLASTGEIDGNGVEVGASEEHPARTMTQGTGHCSASLELSIVHEDGIRRHYRAKWAIQRAHKTPDGIFQHAKRSLEEFVGGGWKLLVSSDTRKEFIPHFTQMLRGLSFEDFQRTILLAQFKFREFLDADVKGRTDILERMTDSQRFRAIGGRAAAEFQRAEKEEARAKAALDGVAVLSSAERTEVEARIVDERAALARTRTTLDGLEATNKFWNALRDARNAVATADAAVAAVALRRQDARALLDALAEDERIAPARDARAAVEVHEKSAVLLDERLQESRRAEADARANDEATRAVVERAVAAHQTAVDDRAARLPEIEAAAEAWRKADAAREAASRALVAAQSASHDAEKRRNELAAVEAQLARTSQAHAACLDRLASIPASALLLEAAGGVSERAAQLRAREEAAAKADGEHAAAANDLAAHASGRAARAAAADERASAAAAASVAVQEREAALAAATGGATFDAALGSIDAERDAADAAAQRLVALERAAREDEKRAAAVASLDEKAEERARAVDDARGRVDARRADDRLAADQHEDARASLRTSDALLAVLDHRDVLRDGEACPVCGSEEHPWVAFPERAPKLDDERARHAVLAARVEAAAAAARQAAAQLKDAEVDEAKLAQALDEVRRQAVEQRAEHDKARAERERCAREVGVDVSVTTAWIDSALVEANARRSAIVQRAATLRELGKALRESEDRRRLAADEQAAAERSLKEHDDKATILGERVATLEAQARDRRQEAAQARERLVALLAELSVDVADVHAAAAEVARRAELVRRQTEELQQVDERVRDLEPKVASARTALDEAIAKEAGARTDAETMAADATATRGVAQAMLGGVAPVDERARLDAAVALRAGEEASARDASSKATTAAAAAAATATAREEEARGAAARVSQARDALAALLATLALGSIDDVDARTLPDARRSEAIACRDGLVVDEQKARTLQAAAASGLAAVASSRPVGEPEDAVPDDRLSILATSLGEVRAEVERLLQATAVDEKCLVNDDVARAKAAGAGEALAKAQADREQWGLVHRLIGMNAGAQFATVVQSLQLRQVLAHANDNLARFMPRYALEQIVHATLGPQLDFRVVDKDQQSAVRSIQSLSGGESFVVSLALALGLAAIRSSRLRIETLLIDEGFGSLDGDTLAIAHQALEALQVAAGVQIGVISHVGTLKELIAAQIVVEPTGGGVSRIRSTGAPASTSE